MTSEAVDKIQKLVFDQFYSPYLHSLATKGDLDVLRGAATYLLGCPEPAVGTNERKDWLLLGHLVNRIDQYQRDERKAEAASIDRINARQSALASSLLRHSGV